MAQPSILHTNYPNGVAANSSTTTLVLTPTCTAMTSTNLAILVAVLDAGGLAGCSISTPSGWTLLVNQGYSDGTDSSFQQETAIYYRTGFTGTSQAITLNCTGVAGNSFYGCAQLIEISGANNTNPTNAYTSMTQTGSATTPQTLTGSSVTPTINDGLCLGIWGWNDTGIDTAGQTVQTGWTVSNDAFVSSNTNYASGYIAYQTAATTSGTPITPTLNLPVNAGGFTQTFNSVTWVINSASDGTAWTQPIADQMRLLGMIH